MRDVRKLVRLFSCKKLTNLTENIQNTTRERSLLERKSGFAHLKLIMLLVADGNVFLVRRNEISEMLFELNPLTVSRRETIYLFDYLYMRGSFWIIQSLSSSQMES